MTRQDADELLAEAIRRAKAAGIPVSARIDPHVRLNRRARTRFGCCFFEDGGYVIELAERLLSSTREACLQTLAHEVLHTCPGCQNHGERWKAYAARLNALYGWHIRRTDRPENLGLPPAAVTAVRRFRVVCTGCGREFYRQRTSRLIAHPGLYRCARCGGRLRVETLTPPESIIPN